MADYPELKIILLPLPLLLLLLLFLLLLLCGPHLEHHNLSQAICCHLYFSTLLIVSGLTLLLLGLFFLLM
jgi:hypothetical protein